MSTSDDEFPPEVLEWIDKARTARVAVQVNEPDFFAAVSSAMFKYDPVGINFGNNTDEYDAEAGTVIPRLRAWSSIEDTARVLREEFVAWFGAETTGDIASFRALASDIWRLKCERDA